jgi:putative spermidine/putrescine transport system ATP-binding protein
MRPSMAAVSPAARCARPLYREPELEAHVAFVGVEKTYDGTSLVVRDLNLTIRRGEFLTFLGPSGSGKTTSLMMLAGFEMPTRGEILLDGRSLLRLPPHRRNIGMVFQNYALFPHMTVAENVAFPLSVRGRPKAETEAEVRRALDMVQLGSFGARRPAQLSGGQQQRVALARALVFSPQLVLMDEPLGALDKQLREQMQFEIKAIHERLGVTVVYVTHDQGEALTMSDRIAVFRQGAIQQIGSPTDLYDAPASSFVAHFIGENNRLQGVVERVEGGLCQVRLPDGALLTARHGQDLASAGPCSLSIRPERIRLGTAPADNRLTGQLGDATFHGDHVRLRVDIGGGVALVVKMGRGEAPADLERGQSVTVGFDARDCRVLDPLDSLPEMAVL